MWKELTFSGDIIPARMHCLCISPSHAADFIMDAAPVIAIEGDEKLQ
jgi:hypothetical protein